MGSLLRNKYRRRIWRTYEKIIDETIIKMECHTIFDELHDINRAGLTSGRAEGAIDASEIETSISSWRITNYSATTWLISKNIIEKDAALERRFLTYPCWFQPTLEETEDILLGYTFTYENQSWCENYWCSNSCSMFNYLLRLYNSRQTSR